MFALLILSPFAVSLLALWLAGRHPARAGLLAAWPALLAVALASQFPAALDGPLTIVVPWAPSLGLALAFNLDGLGLLFAFLITAIGSLIVL